MTATLLDRRVLLCAGGSVLVSGVSGLLSPAHAKGVEPTRTMRGGDFQYTAGDLRPANRFPGTAGAWWLGSGLRCAYDP